MKKAAAAQSAVDQAEQTDVEDFSDIQQEKPKPAEIKDGNLQTVEII
jgi:hypothetical protein